LTRRIKPTAQPPLAQANINRFSQLEKVDEENQQMLPAPQAPRPRSRDTKIRVLTREELEFFKKGRQSSPMTFLYFTGCQRGPIHRIKSILLTAGINLHKIRYIKLIGKRIMK
jgi:hypothetical protein